MLIPTTLGDLPDTRLRRHITAHEDDERIVQTDEYCLLECRGAAHVTGHATGQGCFCPHHVHRSVHVTMKRWPEGDLAGATALFG